MKRKILRWTAVSVILFAGVVGAIPGIFPEATQAAVESITESSDSSVAQTTKTKQPKKVNVKKTAAKKITKETAVSTSESSTTPSVTTSESTEASVSSEAAASTTAESTSQTSQSSSSEATAASESAAGPASTTVETITTTPAPVETMGANQLKIAGTYISYQNAGTGSGQAVIDSNPNTVATWGGASVQSGSDNLNTHFIGHNPGIFNVLFQLGGGSTIQVSDSNGQITTYTVNSIIQVNDSGIGTDGVDYYDQIAGSGGGERITLQTCINSSTNLIVFASA